MTPHETLVMFLSLAVLLVTARVLAEICRRMRQPAILGELIAGIILGPTVLGTVLPDVSSFLFPRSETLNAFFDGFRTLAVVLFLLVAGMEVDVSTVWRQGRSAVAVSIAGIAVPAAVGFLFARAAPLTLGFHAGGNELVFQLFMATALAISALPVIAKTLMDLRLYRTDVGMLVIAAAVVDDISGWLLFAMILSLLGVSAGHEFGIAATVGMTLGFTAFMLTVGRQLFHRVLPWIQAHTEWPAGVLGFSLSLALLGAALTEWIGIHAIFGSFLVGIAIGDSTHLREQTRMTIQQFVSFIFAPIFFAGIGLRVNFITNFDLPLTLTILVIACAGKLLGCGFGGRLGGMSWRDSLAVAFAMNARGAMEIVLGLLALQYGVIGERLFVSLVVMAIATSLMSGPAIRFILGLERRKGLPDYLHPKAFIPRLLGSDPRSVIEEIVKLLAVHSDVDASQAVAAVQEREDVLATGLGDGIAVPHARVEGLVAPVIGVGISPQGVDFNAPDGKPARLVFAILSPPHDDGAQVAVLADIARRFRSPEAREQAVHVRSYTEFLALLKTESTSDVEACRK